MSIDYKFDLFFKRITATSFKSIRTFAKCFGMRCQPLPGLWVPWALQPPRLLTRLCRVHYDLLPCRSLATQDCICPLACGGIWFWHVAHLRESSWCRSMGSQSLPSFFRLGSTWQSRSFPPFSSSSHWYQWRVPCRKWPTSPRDHLWNYARHRSEICSYSL